MGGCSTAMWFVVRDVETCLMLIVTSVDYLLNPPPTSHEARPAVAITILVLYFVLVVLIATTYFRVLFTIAINPGYVPKGPAYLQAKLERQRRQGTSQKPRSTEKDWTDENTRPSTQYSATMGGRPSPEVETASLESFWKKDCFVCEGDGRPVWCSMCSNWKPDRTHHCREIGRCVRRMDHFCPWLVLR